MSEIYINDHAEDALNYLRSYRKQKSPLAKALENPTHKKEPSMSELSSTILAFQVMNGLKLYWVYTYMADNSAGPGSIIRSFAELQPGNSIIFSLNNSFHVGRVSSQLEDFSYSDSDRFGWFISLVENPQLRFSDLERKNREAEMKIAQARAIKAARDLVEASGLSAEDFRSLTSE